MKPQIIKLMAYWLEKRSGKCYFNQAMVNHRRKGATIVIVVLYIKCAEARIKNKRIVRTSLYVANKLNFLQTTGVYMQILKSIKNKFWLKSYLLLYGWKMFLFFTRKHIFLSFCIKKGA